MTTKQVFTENDYPSHEAGISDVSNAINEAVESKTLIAAQNDHLKDIASRMKEEYDIPPAIFNKLVKHAYDEASKDAEDQKHDVISVGYDLFVKNNNRNNDLGITMEGIAERDEKLRQLELEV